MVNEVGYDLVFVINILKLFLLASQKEVNNEKNLLFVGYIISYLLTNCSNSNNPEAVVYTSKVKDLINYKEDKAQCMKMASNIDLTSEIATQALAEGGARVSQLLGFLPTISFIAAGTAL